MTATTTRPETASTARQNTPPALPAGPAAIAALEALTMTASTLAHLAGPAGLAVGGGAAVATAAVGVAAGRARARRRPSTSKTAVGAALTGAKAGRRTGIGAGLGSRRGSTAGGRGGLRTGTGAGRAAGAGRRSPLAGLGAKRAGGASGRSPLASLRRTAMTGAGKPGAASPKRPTVGGGSLRLSSGHAGRPGSSSNRRPGAGLGSLLRGISGRPTKGKGTSKPTKGSTPAGRRRPVAAALGKLGKAARGRGASASKPKGVTGKGGAKGKVGGAGAKGKVTGTTVPARKGKSQSTTPAATGRIAKLARRAARANQRRRAHNRKANAAASKALRKHGAGTPRELAKVARDAVRKKLDGKASVERKRKHSGRKLGLRARARAAARRRWLMAKVAAKTWVKAQAKLAAAKVWRKARKVLRRAAKAIAARLVGLAATTEAAQKPLTTTLDGDPDKDAVDDHDPVGDETDDDGKPIVIGGPDEDKQKGPIVSTLGRSLEEKAAELAVLTSGWQPDGMLEWIRVVGSLAPVAHYVADMVGHLVKGAEDLPVEPSAIAALASIENVLRVAVQTAAEAHATVRMVHADDLVRHAAPRRNEQKWDISANQGQQA